MLKRLIPFLVVVLLIGAFLLYRRTGNKIGDTSAYQGANVVLITIDTLRADHLPAYGYQQIQTPAIDLLARESLIFEDAVAHSPMTLPSHASILTGLLPIAHGVRDNAGFKLAQNASTLAEILKMHGYSTAAFVSSFVLDSQFGLDQGFDLYSDTFTLAKPRVNNTDTQRRAEETQAEVDAWLAKNRSSKFFLWVHYYDPHDPYEPPDAFRSSTVPYDGEIVYTDHVLGRLLKGIEPWKENTIVILAGDHGESLGEHKEQTHSLFIYNATQHVPLLLRTPRATHKRIDGVVGLIDVAPTILDWLGISPAAAMQGKTLLPLILGREKTGRSTYSESLFAELHYGWSPLSSLTTTEYKYIEAPTRELYDRKKDRSETQNLAAQKPAVVKEMQDQLSLLVRNNSRLSRTSAHRLDPEAEEKLRALGYVGTSVSRTPESRRIDPKDRIDVLGKISTARKAIDRKNYSEALRIVKDILAQDERMVDAHFIAATAHLHLRQNEQALEQMMATIQLKPDHTQTLYNLAFFHQITGNPAQAERWYEQLLQHEPEHLLGNLNLVSLYRSMNKTSRAEERLNKVLTLYADAAKTTTSGEVRSQLLEKLAEIQYKTGDIEESKKSIEEAIALTPERAILHYHLGVIHQAQKLNDAARAHYAKALQLESNNEALRRAINNQLQALDQR